MANPTTNLNITLPIPDNENTRGTWGTTVNDAFQSLDDVIVANSGGTFTGVVTMASPVLTSPVINTGVSGTAILDVDNMSTASDTTLATSESIKAYVDAQVTAQDLDFQGDSGGTLNIDLDSESLTVAGGTGLSSVGSSNTITVNLDNTAVTPASYGTATAIPAITVDQQGRITAASTNAISTSFNLNADTGTTDSFAVGGTLNLLGGSGLTSTVSNDTVTFALDNLTGHITSTGSATTLGSFTAAQLSSALSDASISGTNTGDQTTISGNAATATTATTATTINAVVNNNNETTWLCLLDGNTGTQGIETNVGLTFNPSTGILTTTGFAGALTGNATTASTASALTSSASISTSGTIVTTANSGFTSKGIDDNSTTNTKITISDSGVTVGGTLLVTSDIEANNASFMNTDIIGNFTGGGSGGDLTWARSGVTKFFVDTSAGRVGILQASPGYTLDVGGTFRVTGAATFDSTISASGLSGTNTGDQTLPTDFVSAANGGTFSRWVAGVEGSETDYQLYNTGGSNGVRFRLTQAGLSTFYDGMTISNLQTGFDVSSHLKLENLNNLADAYTGITFRAYTENAGKGWFGFERVDHYGRGNFVFLLNSVADNSSVATSYEVVRITDNGELNMNGNSSYWLETDGTSVLNELTTSGTTTFNATATANVGMTVSKSTSGFTADSHLKLENLNDSDQDRTGILFRARSANAGKAWFGFERMNAYGRGDFVFLLDNASDDLSVTTTDEVFRLIAGTPGATGSMGINNSNAQGYYTGARNLVVGDHSAEHGMTICSSTSEQGRIAFADGTGSYDHYGMIEYNHSGDTMSFQTNNAVRMTIDSSGHVGPGANGSQDLGADGARWRNIYTSDLQMSNEGIGGNEVDGTEGSWTIQEGDENLFVINRITGKKFKIKLAEV